MKKLICAAMASAIVLLSGCRGEAQVASENLSKDADNFEVPRRIVFYNGYTGNYILSIEGYCSLEDNAKQLKVTCKTGQSSYKKHYLGLSDNVTYFAEQMDSHKTSGFNYKVNFRPETIIPELHVITSSNVKNGGAQ